MPNIQGELHVDGYLTSYSEAFTQDAKNFITPRAASNIPVVYASDKYARYDRGYFWRDEAAVRPMGGRPVQVSYKVEPGNYNAEEWALEHTVDDRQRRNTDAPIKLDENATKLLTQKQLIRSDRLWCTAFFKPSVWTNDYVGNVDFLPFNDVTCDPVAIIDGYINIMAEQTGMRPNTLTIGANVYTALRSNPQMKDIIKYTKGGVLNEDIMAALFGLDRVQVARAVYNAGLEGAANDFRFIANKDAALLAYIEDSPSLDSPTAIARFAWTGLIPGAMNEYGGVMERGRDDRAHSDYFQNRTAFDLAQVSPDLGIFLAAASVPTSDLQHRP